MAESVGSHEVIFRFSRGNRIDYLLETFVIGERKKHGLDVGIVDPHMLHAVLLFVATGKLMLFNPSLHVVVYPGCNYYTILRATVHGLRVNIVVVLLVLDKPSVVLEKPEILHGFSVDFRIVLINLGPEINFRLYDVIERLGIALSFLSGLFRVKNIVRARSHVGDKLAWRTHTFKRFYFCHKEIFQVGFKV